VKALIYVMANMFLHHVEKPGQAILEMTRILKPGGKLVIADLDRHDYEFLPKNSLMSGLALNARISENGLPKRTCPI